MSTKIEKLNKKLKKEKEKDIKYANSDNKELLEKCKYEFDKYQNKDSYYYDSTNELYNYIKNKYIKKISDGNFNIKIERIRIERSLGNHKKISEKLTASNIALMTSIITVSIGTMFKLLEDWTKDNSMPWYGIWIFLIALMIVLTREIYKSNKDSNANERDLVNYISLKVLDDIENGIID
ncbi:hypothetical protein DMN31_09245 [Clostridium perfringens]|uniref:hypothetical protein n=1 Tax=Clostridium perfringens TaxID=1502 RepID=UPI002244FD8D|nr:hypothetical protein [Clostridium perfringens]EHK2389587.1 hypothetical protein [Clostridium perfringens]ELC8420073.1 hypothetical protein [Clostridium perfringens]MCX0381333.1 hypothetical protein [Clostridium perfringens]